MKHRPGDLLQLTNFYANNQAYGFVKAATRPGAHPQLCVIVPISWVMFLGEEAHRPGLSQYRVLTSKGPLWFSEAWLKS